MRQRGSIRKMCEGRFRIAIYLGIDTNGKRKYYYETIHCSNKKEAQKYLTQKLNEIDNGAFIKPVNMTLREYLDEWEENTLKARVRPKTYKSYKQLIELYIKPHLENFKIKDINSLLIQNMYTAMITKGLSPRTVRSTHTVLKNALNQAIKWQIMKTNPCDNVDLPKQAR